MKVNDFLPVRATAPFMDKAPYTAANLVNDYGLDSPYSKSAVHDNHKIGDTMWLVQNQKQSLEIIFDLEGFYPLGEMWVWNYNRFDKDTPQINYTLCGLREVSLYTSIDGMKWRSIGGQNGRVVFEKADGSKELKATNQADGTPVDFGGITTRYVKLSVCAEPGKGNWDENNQFQNAFGLSKVMFFVGEGYASEPDAEWSDAFVSYNGWTGSDGVFTIPMNGRESFHANVDTVITFGDTLINRIDPVTDHRDKDLQMIHNCYCTIKNSVPSKDNIQFFWNEKQDKTTESVFVPDIRMQNDTSSQGYFWPQDSVLVDGNCYTFPMTVLDYPDGPEGFQFKVDGVSLIVSPIEEGRIKFEQGRQYKTGLYYDAKGKGDILFGGCILPNTESAGAVDPDGYLYVYGHRNQNFSTNLLVARVPEHEIINCSAWRFFDGRDWNEDISRSEAIAENVSCEMSVSLVKGKLNKGKYMLVFQEYVNSPVISFRIGESPVGPFSEIKQLYCCAEPFQGRGIYAYNAKGHPHLTQDGELLISYNVNTISWDMHFKHGSICRPRFIRMKEIVR